MFRFFRKHRWILIIALSIVAITFVFWGVGPAAQSGGGVANSNFGSIYGQQISRQEYENAKREFYIFYWFQHHEWPDNMKEADQEQEIYLRLMLAKKAELLGIHVSDESAASAALAMLRSLDSNGQHVSPELFVQRVLNQEPVDGKPLGNEDFALFARRDLAIQQLIRAMGMTGNLITPQDAQAIYQKDYQELAAQMVSFSASNYLSEVTATPAQVAQFYTNEMAYYRLPDRVQVSYVEFNVTNFMAQAKAALTNLSDIVDANYQRLGPDAFPDAKTPEAAKAEIREQIIRQQALADAAKVANEFDTEVYNKTPLSASNFVALAKQQGLALHTPKPFGRQYGPEEFLAPATFVQAAFDLTPDNPISEVVRGQDGVYVLALDGQFPSEIPPLEQIRSQVATDLQTQEAIALAQRAGSNFVMRLQVQMAAGKTFASACVADGLHPDVLPSFSLSTKVLPGLDEHVDLSQLQQAAFSTPVGHASNFEETQYGGFVVYVEKKLPLDRTAMKNDLPQFIERLRGQRENEMFQEWLGAEANRELGSTPLAKQMNKGGQ